MRTFTSAVTDLLSWVARPGAEAEMTIRAKACINEAIRFANRSYSFKYAEKAAKITYPGQAFMISLGSVCDGRIIGINSIQVISGMEFEGLPIPITTYENLQQIRRNTAKNYPAYTITDYAKMAIRECDGYAGFLLGSSLGLYPRPSSDITLLVTYNSLLDELVNDADTNFILEYGYDFVISKALQKFNIYLKADSRVEISDKQIAVEWDSLLSWDRNVISSHALSL